MGTAERRLQIMKQLCRQRYATMPELAEKYAVSVRTIQRDIFELTFLMPVYVKSGRHDGGIYVEESYHMDRMYMNDSELELLNKVQTMVANKLSDKEKYIFKNIINSYSKPV